MSDQDKWIQGNERYLAATLAWLRLRLELRLEKLRAKAESAEAPEAAPDAPREHGLLSHLLPHHHPDHREAGGAEPGQPPVVPVAPVAKERPDPRVEAVRRRVDEAATDRLAAGRSVEPAPALIRLEAKLGLSAYERDILLMCAAMELDPDVASLYAAAQPGLGNCPTFALARVLFDDPAWDAMAPDGPLRHLRLVEINQPGSQPLVTSALRADERIVNCIKGLNYLDDRISPLVGIVPAPGPADVLPPSQQQALARTLRAWPEARRAGAAGPARVIQLLGPDEAGKRLVAAHAAAVRRSRLFRLPAESIPSHPADLETLARLWQREAMLSSLALYVDAQEPVSAPAPEAPPSPLAPLARFLERTRGTVLLATREPWGRPESADARVDVPRPSADEQAAAWRRELGPVADDLPRRLAGQFDLSAADIRRAAGLATDRSPSAAPAAPGAPGAPGAAASDLPLGERLWDACRDAARPRMDALARRIDAKATWDDLVVPDEQSRLLRQIADQVGQRGRVYQEWGFERKMNRGLGISALFAGESGTGKTMAAEVLANHLRLHLYRIDLSAVVNKYIGETEKNLRRLFDAAEGGGAILFFDEADALFGKRSEVKDSHDRYANIEVNYLLQRMESYRGLAILATNMKSAMDPAFLRRLRFVVNLPRPSRADRRRMWVNAFPQAMPEPDLDYDRLSKLDLTGGNIHGIALNAAFLAAAASTAVTMPMVLGAARDEFRKLERPINAADFEWEPAGGNASGPNARRVAS